MQETKRAVVILSGGMDSTLCATMAIRDGYEVIALHFDYNQLTMDRERRAFHDVCDALKIESRYTLDVGFISQIGGSALTDTSIPVPKDGLSNNIPSTYVPYRNGIFISVAAALAEKNQADAIFIGVVQADSSGYPDCTDDFIMAQQQAINIGTATSKKIKIVTPLVNLKKSEIVKQSIMLNSPLASTWSCYENSDFACGECDSCLLRLRGFKEANATDPIPYQNNSNK